MCATINETRTSDRAKTAFMGLGHDMGTVMAAALRMLPVWGESLPARNVRSPQPRQGHRSSGYTLLMELGREIRGR